MRSPFSPFLPAVLFVVAAVPIGGCEGDGSEPLEHGGKADQASCQAADGCADDDCPDPAHPSVDYISQDPLDCAVIAFACDDGETGFSDDCGCGCIDAALAECPDPADPGVHYLIDSNEDPSVCLVIVFTCEDGQTAFSDDCGCGCIDDEPADCPDPADPSVHYLIDSNEDPSVCLVISFACEEGQTAFSNSCGCGCVDDA